MDLRLYLMSQRYSYLALTNTDIAVLLKNNFEMIFYIKTVIFNILSKALYKARWRIKVSVGFSNIV